MTSRIDYRPISEVKTVVKPWGEERWIQAGSDVYPYVLKTLLLKAGQRTSIQAHKQKSETILILQGTGTLLHGEEFFDCEAYERGEITQDQVNEILGNLKSIDLVPGATFDTPPGTVHRMIATTDLMYVEASTTELDDVIRLQDDQNRTHGRIDSEHK